MAEKDDQNDLSSSTDDDDSSSTSLSTTTDDDDDNDDEQVDDESDDNLSALTPKQAYASLEIKRKNLGKRLLELRDELKAQPQADIDTKKRLLTEIKNLREKWIAVQTRLTNLKARLSHSATPERQPAPKKAEAAKQETIEPEIKERIIPPPRIRTRSYSSSSRSRSSSNESIRSNRKSYRDLDALGNENIQNNHPDNRTIESIRHKTSYRDLTDDRSLSRSPSPASSSSSLLQSNEIPISDLSIRELKTSKTNNNEDNIYNIADEIEKDNDNNTDDDDENKDDNIKSKQTFYNQAIPYPVVNDKRDIEIINRQIKNQLREFEASKNNPLYDTQSNLMNYERLKKQNEYINLKLKIEKLKRIKTKTQREKEQNKKQFHAHLQEFRKLQRFMRSANRDYSNNQFFMIGNETIPTSSIPLPPIPEIKNDEDVQLPPIDLHRVTGKKIIFESSDSDEQEEEETTKNPQVPVSLSVSEPRTVPDGYDVKQIPPLPMPSNSSSSVTLDAIKSRVANLINPSNTHTETSTNKRPDKDDGGNNDNNDDDDDDDDNENENQPKINPDRIQAVSVKFNRKRRKTKRNRNKKKGNKTQTTQQINNENESTIIDHEEAWRRYAAMQIQFQLLKKSNPILRALTVEAHKKLGITQEEVREFQFDDEMMDYQTALILQQQEEFLAAAAANPFNVLHNAAVGSSSSRPTLVDVLSNLNGGIPSSSEPQTPMGLLQKFFLDANNNSNAEQRSSFNLNELSSTPPTPPPPRDISIGKRIVESLTHQDINALLKLSGSEHDDDDDYDDDDGNYGDNGNKSLDGDTDDDTNNFSIDEDSNDVPNGTNNNSTNNNKNYERWVRSMPIPARPTQSSSISNKKSTIDTLILPSFNRCTHLGKSTKRSAGVERMFPSFSKHNSGPPSTLNLILYGLSSTP